MIHEELSIYGYYKKKREDLHPCWTSNLGDPVSKSRKNNRLPQNLIWLLIHGKQTNDGTYLKLTDGGHNHSGCLGAGEQSTRLITSLLTKRHGQ